MGDGRRYRVLGVLGKGGFGTVYRAELIGSSGFTRQVALKVLNPEVEGVASIAERLRDEARVLGLLRHRAIVQVDGLVQLDDRWTVVMEFIEGVDLSRLVAHGPTPPRPALEIVGEVASALHVAHTWPGPDGQPLGLLHRDLKPQNLLLTSAGETKVLDFGVARANFGGREAVTRGIWFGSPGYVAPERMSGDEGPAADVFALGVVLYELLTGRLLGKTSRTEPKHRAFVQQALGGLSELAPQVRALLEQMLEFEVDARPDARQVEGRCRELVAVAQGPFLRDWAEQIVPEMLAAPAHVDSPSHDFSGSVLVERASQAGETSFGVLDDPSGEWGQLVPPESDLTTEVPEVDVPEAAPQPAPPQPAPPEPALPRPAPQQPPAPLPVSEPAASTLPPEEGGAELPVPVVSEPSPPPRRRRGGSGLGKVVLIVAFAIFAGLAFTALIWGSYLLFVILISWPYYGYGYGY